MPNKIYINLLIILLSISIPGIVTSDAVKDIAKKAADAAFSEAERQAIEKYYELTAPIRGKEYRKEQDDNGDGKKKSEGNKKDKSKNKRKELPKGITKKLERGGTLPPGMTKRGLPDDLEKQLQPVPKGYERIISGGQVVLTDIATGIISDVINIGGKSETIKNKDKSVTKSSIPKEGEALEKSQSPGKVEKKWWQFWKN